MLDPSIVLERLAKGSPTVLSTLPDAQGIYGLIDHLGIIRYIGVTASESEGFKIRIHGKHVTGSEGRSHKFSHAYNSGRMWRSYKPHPKQHPADAKLAKLLRTQFCRRHCRAVYVPIDRAEFKDNYFAGLTLLETSVKGIAPEHMRDWERLHFKEVAEPETLVDVLIAELGWSEDQRQAVLRQAALYSEQA